MRGIIRIAFALALLGLVTEASAQWSDNFDSYAPGNINGQGGWKGWGNVPAQAPIVTNTLSLSAPNSVFVSGNAAGTTYADNVHEYSGYTSGQWRYTANVFVPTNATGDAYFILLNRYADPGPFNWSVEMQLNATTGQFIDDFTGGVVAPHMRTGGPAPLIRNRWVPIQVDFDLTANTVNILYDGLPFSSGTWTTNGTSTLTLAAVDLFSNASSGVNFDNLSLVRIPEPATFSLLGLGALALLRRRRA